MLNPTHKTKQFVRDAYQRWAHWTLSDAYGWLATDILDADGRDIYEGDIVQLVGDDEHQAPVTWHDACFWIDEMPLGSFADGDLKIVGHIAEDSP